MKFSLNIITALLSIAGAVVQAAPSKVSYDGTQVIRIDIGQDPKQVTQVEKLVSELQLAQWTDVIAAETHVDVEVPKSKISAFRKGSKGLQTTVMHEDLGKSIAAEAAVEEGGFSIAADSTFFNNYHPYAEHLTFMNELVAQYPSRAEIVTAGTSYQGRPITGIHIFGSAGKGKKPAVIFHGTVHAREWITGMTNQYFSWYLLSNYATNAAIKAYVDKYDFYIFPVTNPDGFIYTQSTQRLWRKNRQPTAGSTCIGHDINRNWSWKWELTGGASTDPCNETFKGVTAGDTPEFKGLSAFQNGLKATTPGVKMFIDWHSYSQLFMTPYGYTCTAVPADNTELVNLARGGSAAISAVYGTTYKYGPICPTIYKATGGSVDYSYDVTKIKYSFTLELRDLGNYGFVLPASQIRPTAVESWAGLKYLLDNMV